MSKSNYIRVLFKAPGKEPGWREIPNDLESFQALVKGHIECVPWDDRYLMIVNGEGKLEGLRYNFRFYGDDIVGPVVWVAKDGLEFAGILDDKFKDEVTFFTVGGNAEDDEDDILNVVLDDLYKEMLKRLEKGGMR